MFVHSGSVEKMKRERSGSVVRLGGFSSFGQLVYKKNQRMHREVDGWSGNYGRMRNGGSAENGIQCDGGGGVD